MYVTEGKWWWITQGGRCVHSRAGETDAVVSSVAVSDRRGSSPSDLITISPLLFYFQLSLRPLAPIPRRM
ncbi:hypothetical protein CAJAP_02842 [Camponotus japonicus]